MTIDHCIHSCFPKIIDIRINHCDPQVFRSNLSALLMSFHQQKARIMLQWRGKVNFFSKEMKKICHQSWWWRSARNAIRFKMRKADWQNVIFDEKVWLLSLRSPEDYKKRSPDDDAWMSSSVRLRTSLGIFDTRNTSTANIRHLS